MDVEKKAVFRRINGEEAVDNKKLLLETEINTIQLLKLIERFKLVRQLDEEQTLNARKSMGGVKEAVHKLLEALPKTERVKIIEEKIIKKVGKKKTDYGKLGDLDTELKMIKEKLNSLG